MDCVWILSSSEGAIQATIHSGQTDILVQGKDLDRGLDVLATRAADSLAVKFIFGGKGISMSELVGGWLPGLLRRRGRWALMLANTALEQSRCSWRSECDYAVKGVL